MPAQVKLYISRNGAPGNPAIATHFFDIPHVTGPQLVAQCIAAYTSQEVICASQTIDMVEANFGDLFGPLTPQPFPTVQYAALVTANPGLVPQPGYGSPFGLPTTLPLGTSLLMREATAEARRHWGRSFLPWPSSSALNTATGGPSAAAFAQTVVWSNYIRGLRPGCSIATAVVRRGTVAAPVVAAITAQTLQPNFARLRSRLR